EERDWLHLDRLAGNVQTAVKEAPQVKGGVQWLSSKLPWAELKITGDFIGINFGGTNLEVALVHLEPGKEPKIKETVSEKLPEALKTASADKIFNYVANAINRLPLENGKHYQAGFVFSFPMEHESANVAIVRGKDIKGWSLNGIDGENPARLLEEAMKKHPALVEKEASISIEALMNDTVATQFSVIGALIGIIHGTGFNFSITDPVTGEIINLEAGGFDDIPIELITEADEAVYQNEKPLNEHRFEKMISGGYLVKLLRHRITQIAQESPISHPVFAKMADGSWKDDKGEDIDGQLLSDLVSALSFSEMIRVINKYFRFSVTSLSRNEYIMLKALSINLLERSGFLLGTVIGGMLTELESKKHREKYRIAIDGSVFRKNKIVQRAFWEALERQRWGQDRVEIGMPENATTVGASIGAAIKTQKDREQPGVSQKSGEDVQGSAAMATDIDMLKQQIDKLQRAKGKDRKRLVEYQHQLGLLEKQQRREQKHASRMGQDKSSPNNAMTNGGIDLASRHLRMQRDGLKVDMRFNKAMISRLRQGDFSGVRIEVMGVDQIDLGQLLGLRRDENMVGLVRP
ncbi:MAG: hypothetical protein HQL13_08735, partial [Candidatus Omnitrophica bacterium]|nr:hypothetical protein [Candidatus Omnitrophota bacterium]